MMETVNASLEHQQLDDVISSMFKAAGFENKEALSLEDFILLMGDHKEELSQAALTLQGKQIKNLMEYTTLLKRYRLIASRDKQEFHKSVHIVLPAAI